MTDSDFSGVPRRIAMCITELEPGGAERNLVELALGLDPRKFTPQVFCLGSRPKQVVQLVERLDQGGIPVHFFDGRGFASAVPVFLRLRKSFRDWRPHIVQTFLWHANVLGPLAARAAGIPHVVTGLRVAEPGRRWRRPIERWASRWADHHVAVSEGVADFAREQIGLSAAKICVIPNGVAIQREPAAPIDLAKLGVQPGQRALLFVGRLDPQKGCVELVEHAGELLSRLPHHDLLIVGEGPARSEIERERNAQGLHDRIHLAGWRADIAEIMAAAEVLLAPSRWEGMSNVVLEAMASRLPVVAFAVEGTQELLGDDSPALTAPRDDWPTFIERTVLLASDDSTRKKIALALGERAENRFSLAAMIAGYERLFLSLTA
jgi:glycosyltransferase involved in cell wall biosynthesis